MIKIKIRTRKNSLPDNTWRIFNPESKRYYLCRNAERSGQQNVGSWFPLFKLHFRKNKLAVVSSMRDKKGSLSIIPYDKNNNTRSAAVFEVLRETSPG